MAANNPLDERSTKRYYNSGDRSALQHTCADSVLKPGENLPSSAPKASLKDLDERGTDRIYANPKAPGRAPTGSTTQRVHHKQSAHPEVVSSPEDVGPAVARAVERLRDGQPRVLIEVADAKLVLPTRTRLDLLVTREIITEDQGRDIAVVVAKPPPESFPPALFKREPIPEPVTIDPAAFLKHDDAAETEAELKQVEPGSVNVVDTSDDNDFAAAPPKEETSIEVKDAAQLSDEAVVQKIDPPEPPKGPTGKSKPRR